MSGEIIPREWIADKLKRAKEDLKKKKYVNAAKIFQEVAREYEKDPHLSAEAIKYYTKAAKTYFSAGKKGFDKFTELIGKNILVLLTDPWEKVDALIDGANPLLKAGEFKKGAELIGKLKDIYKKELNDKEKAKFYEELVKEVKQGAVKKIENPK